MSKKLLVLASSALLLGISLRWMAKPVSANDEMKDEDRLKNSGVVLQEILTLWFSRLC